MSKFKKAVLDTSLFRRSYIICLFCSNISFVLIPAYAVLAVLFIWGVFLMIYNERRYHTILKTRYGAWLVAFLLSSTITCIIHLADSFLYNAYNVIMLLHVALCFFVFYGVHTEKHLNFRRELYSVCRFIVYITTVLGVMGLAFLIRQRLRDLLLSHAVKEGFHRDLGQRTRQPYMDRFVRRDQRDLADPVRFQRCVDADDLLRDLLPDL